MASPLRQPLYTIEEYLRIERQSEERHEYLDGEIYQMAGESDAHGDISANLVGILVSELRGTPCRARTKDTKVRSSPLTHPRRSVKGLFSYPDIVVICGAPQHHDQHRDVIINPAVIIEVLSESTAEFDRVEKFHRYQTWNPTLTDYLLVSQDKLQVEHYIRQRDGGWLYYVYEGLEAGFAVESINCSLKLAEIFDRIEFPIEDEEAAE